MVCRRTSDIVKVSDNGRSACMCSGQYWADYWKPYWVFCCWSGEHNAANKVDISLWSSSINQCFFFCFFFYWWSNWIGFRAIIFFNLVNFFDAANLSFVRWNNRDRISIPVKTTNESLHWLLWMFHHFRAINQCVFNECLVGHSNDHKIIFFIRLLCPADETLTNWPQWLKDPDCNEFIWPRSNRTNQTTTKYH